MTYVHKLKVSTVFCLEMRTLSDNNLQIWKNQQDGNNLFSTLTLDRTKHHKLPAAWAHAVYGG